jgi:hypothetical protein
MSKPEISLEPTVTLEGIPQSWAKVFIALINQECPLPEAQAKALNLSLLKMHAMMLRENHNTQKEPAAAPYIAMSNGQIVHKIDGHVLNWDSDKLSEPGMTSVTKDAFYSWVDAYPGELSFNCSDCTYIDFRLGDRETGVVAAHDNDALEDNWRIRTYLWNMKLPPKSP